MTRNVAWYIFLDTSWFRSKTNQQIMWALIVIKKLFEKLRGLPLLLIKNILTSHQKHEKTNHFWFQRLNTREEWLNYNLKSESILMSDKVYYYVNQQTFRKSEVWAEAPKRDQKYKIQIKLIFEVIVGIVLNEKLEKNKLLSIHRKSIT